MTHTVIWLKSLNLELASRIIHAFYTGLLDGRQLDTCKPTFHERFLALLIRIRLHFYIYHQSVSIREYCVSPLK